MFGPGAYRPDPTEGITAIADLPPPEIVPYSRTDKRQPCPRCGHSAYRDEQFQRTLHDLGIFFLYSVPIFRGDAFYIPCYPPHDTRAPFCGLAFRVTLLLSRWLFRNLSGVAKLGEGCAQGAVRVGLGMTQKIAVGHLWRCRGALYARGVRGISPPRPTLRCA